jgi:hypothetical protein
MADIFISYASEDRSRAEILAKTLEDQGWSVWWDKTIPPGKTFDQVIQEAIESARCVVVLWSKKSINSDWVKEEANIGNERKILVPAKIDPVALPLGFGRIQAADLTNWEAEKEHPGFFSLRNAISDMVGPPKPREKGEQSAEILEPSLENQLEVQHKVGETPHLTTGQTERRSPGSRKTGNVLKFGAVTGVIVLLIAALWWFSQQKGPTDLPKIKGVQLRQNVSKGEKIREDMIQTFKPENSEETSGERPMDFSRDLRGARFMTDLPKGHILEWEDLTTD